uniref:Uncharacterized protein n=1 Tax=Ascaris lumbricoides TaxID=6252 RepID=A0A9J2P4N0_ASCLU
MQYKLKSILRNANDPIYLWQYAAEELEVYIFCVTVSDSSYYNGSDLPTTSGSTDLQKPKVTIVDALRYVISIGKLLLQSLA